MQLATALENMVTAIQKNRLAEKAEEGRRAVLDSPAAQAQVVLLLRQAGIEVEAATIRVYVEEHCSSDDGFVFEVPVMPDVILRGSMDSNGEAFVRFVVDGEYCFGGHLSSPEDMQNMLHSAAQRLIQARAYAAWQRDVDAWNEAMPKEPFTSRAYSLFDASDTVPTCGFVLECVAGAAMWSFMVAGQNPTPFVFIDSEDCEALLQFVKGDAASFSVGGFSMYYSDPESVVHSLHIAYRGEKKVPCFIAPIFASIRYEVGDQIVDDLLRVQEYLQSYEEWEEKGKVLDV